MTTSLGYKFEATAAAEFSDVRAACFQDQRRFRSCACICDRRSEWTDRTNSEFASIPFGKKSVRVWVSDSDEGVEPRLN
jgi:hypothetical protein